MSVDGSTLGYAELLKLAVARDLQELDAVVVQIPTEANGGHAVVLATARTARSLFRALGEAWRDTLPADQRLATLVVAEVRAKTRALCEAVGMPQPLPAATVPVLPVPEKAGPPIAAAAGPARQAPGSSTPAAVLEAAGARAPESADRGSAVQAEGPVQPEPSNEHGAAGRTAARAVLPATPADTAQAGEHTSSPARAGEARAAPRSVQPTPPEGLGPDILRHLIQMTRRKAELEGTDSSEEEAMRKLESFFQRAFGHSMEEGTRMEGQRVRQRLAADLAKLSAGQGDESYVASRG